MKNNSICYSIYVDDGCNEGFYEVDRYYIIETALAKLYQLRKECKYECYWLVIILDE